MSPETVLSRGRVVARGWVYTNGCGSLWRGVENRHAQVSWTKASHVLAADLGTFVWDRSGPLQPFRLSPASPIDSAPYIGSSGKALLQESISYMLVSRTAKRCMC